VLFWNGWVIEIFARVADHAEPLHEAQEHLALGDKDDPWSFPHFDTITVSIADAPWPDEIVVIMAIVDGGRQRNRCGTEPIR
jgi:hypothetical protein